MSKEKSSTRIGITTVLLIVFVVLKLTDNIDWSWLWVLSPFWIPASLVFTLLSSLFAIKCFQAIMNGIKSRRALKQEYDRLQKEKSA